MQLYCVCFFDTGFFLWWYSLCGFLAIKYSLEKTWLYVHEDKRITYRYGVLTLLHCPMQFALWRKERRIHTFCTLVVTIALLMGGFFPQNHNSTIVCSTTTLCKAPRVIIVFRSKSLASALFACFSVQRKSVRGLRNNVYTSGVCLLRAVHLDMWFLSSKL